MPEHCPECSQEDQDLQSLVEKSASKKPPRIGPFTCLFLITFFGVLALLGFVIIPRYHGVGGAEKYQQCRKNLITVNKALDRYTKDNGGKYPATLQSLVPAYLPAIPACPEVRKDSYSESYSMAQDTQPGAYTFYCSGNNHSRLTGGRNFPQYSSRSGLKPEK